MTMTFMSSPSLLVTSESVTEGHPDKVCDQIADAILDDIIAHDPEAHCACEVVATTGLVLVMGEITTDHYVDCSGIARQVIRDIGYNKPEYGFDSESCGVIVSVKEQSPEINAAVGEDEGAGDQGIMLGFACNETPELMPLPISLAHKLCKQLAKVRKDGTLAYLRPDGKSQVTIEYAFGKPKRAHAVVIAAQHDSGISGKQLWDDINKHVIQPIMGDWLDKNTEIHVNRSGSFILGGPAADSGLSGRKNIVDTYGGVGRHGGGSYSGKDPSKVDRSASYAARWVAKNLVAAGLADRAEVELSYAIGHPQPIGVSVETFGTHKIDVMAIQKLVREHFDLSPKGIIRDLRLRRPIYRATASYGHMGRTDIDAPWEETNKADELRKAAAGLEKVKSAETQPA
ncbi:MAG TPA: methionine adenosyltransferase [Dehalococcoidia bacterium]|jgi:S-adenosylmethionine synthetase|nr:methionine adenosyltransferase [Dehalococcoidia bacterium]